VAVRAARLVSVKLLELDCRGTDREISNGEVFNWFDHRLLTQFEDAVTPANQNRLACLDRLIGQPSEAGFRLRKGDGFHADRFRTKSRHPPRHCSPLDSGKPAA